MKLVQAAYVAVKDLEVLNSPVCRRCTISDSSCLIATDNPCFQSRIMHPMLEVPCTSEINLNFMCCKKWSISLITCLSRARKFCIDACIEVSRCSTMVYMFFVCVAVLNAAIVLLTNLRLHVIVMVLALISKGNGCSYWLRAALNLKKMGSGVNLQVSCGVVWHGFTTFRQYLSVWFKPESLLLKLSLLFQHYLASIWN